MLLRLASVSVLVAAAAASTKDDDRVASIPGFEEQFQQGLGFDVYSGYLDVQVPKASTGYDSLSIHCVVSPSVRSNVENSDSVTE